MSFDFAIAAASILASITSLVIAIRTISKVLKTRYRGEAKISIQYKDGTVVEIDKRDLSSEELKELIVRMSEKLDLDKAMKARL